MTKSLYSYVKRRINFASAHKELWLWLSKNPDKERYEWPEWKKYSSTGDVKALPPVEAFCFACEAAVRLKSFNTRSRCDAPCPIEWPPFSKDQQDRAGCSSLFRSWKYAADEKERSRLAYRIAGLPWKGRKFFGMMIFSSIKP